MAYSILEVTDGSGLAGSRVTLLAAVAGVNLKNWDPAIAQYKSGGVFQDSSLSAGRRLVLAEFQWPIESFNLVVNGQGQDDTIDELQNLIRLLQQAINYWLTGRGRVVYIKAKSPCETGVRYADIRSFSIPGIKNPYMAPFFVAQQLAAMDEITLNLERGHWLANAPGVGECLEIGNVQEWAYQGLWVESQGSVATNFSDMLELANGTLLAGGDIGANVIYRSTDDGATWGTVAYPVGFTGPVLAMIQLSNGTVILGSGSDTCTSSDNGASFGGAVTIPVVTLIYGFADVGGGTVLVTTDNGVYRSTDSGASWTQITTNAFAGFSIAVDGNGYYYTSRSDLIYKSIDSGATWTIDYTYLNLILDSPRFFEMDGNLIITVAFYDGSNYIVRMVRLDYLTGIWSIVATIDSFALVTIARRIWGRNNTFFCYIADGGGTSYLYKSFDGGLTWLLDQSGAGPYWDGIIAASGSFFVIDDDRILKYDASLVADMGVSDSCDGELYLSNKISGGNITHIKIDDGGVFTDLFPISVFPQDLLPAVPAANDAIYFGSDTTILGAGVFASLVFDIETIITYTSSYTITWEYWNGAWVSLTVTDNTNVSGAFTQRGICSVHWDQPSDWATTAVDGVTGYWVRARVSALVGTITPPSQQNRQIYSAVNPYLAVDDTEVLGDIPALARYQLFNRSDEDGSGGSAPNLWDNRVIAGLRSFVGSSYFQAYINISDEQEPFGISVSLGTNTSFAADTSAPTGRRATYNPAAVEAMATRVTINLGPTIARDYYGTFHAYLRARRTAGSSTDLSVRLQVVTGSGGITFTSENVQLQGTTAFELLDFGQIDLPVSGGIMDTELPDVTQLNIQASAASGTPDLYLYDLILIPVDEWAIDAVDFVNSVDSVIGQVDAGVYRLMDVDSVAFPLLDIRSLVRQDDSDQLIVAAYDPITNGEAIAQNNIDQRLWVLCARTAAVGADPVWLASPAIAHSVKAYKNERWLALRGDEV